MDPPHPKYVLSVKEQQNFYTTFKIETQCLKTWTTTKNTLELLSGVF